MDTNLPINKVLQGDCLGIIQQWPDNCVDLVLTDPPYGIKEARRDNASRGKQRGGLNNNALGYARDYPIEKWDDVPPSQKYFTAIQRVSKEQVIFGANHFSDKLPASSCWIVWDKDNGNNDFADCELAWCSFKKAVRKFKWKWHGMLQEDMSNKEQRYHRNQKPVALMKWIIERYTKPNDLILDTFVGSGTTCIAAELMGRRYIGIDLSGAYCKIARQRIQAAKDQMGLFPN